MTTLSGAQEANSPSPESPVAGGLGCFADLPLQEALNHLADAGFQAVEVEVREDGPLSPDLVRDDYETAHLLLGFGCARAGLRPTSLRMTVAPPASAGSTALLRFGCTLARALLIPAVTLRLAGQPDSASIEAMLSQWLRLARDRETRLRLFLAHREETAVLVPAALRLGLWLSVDASLVPELNGSAGVLRRVTEVWMRVPGEEGRAVDWEERDASPPLCAGLPQGDSPGAEGLRRLLAVILDRTGAELHVVIACPPFGEPAGRVRRLSAVRQLVTEAGVTGAVPP